MNEDTASIAPDYDMANRYLDALTGSPDGSVTFQFFSDRDKQNRKVATNRHLKRSPAYAFLHNKQKEGCGVYVMVNRGNGKGRSASNVVDVLALFIDLDGAPMEPAVNRLVPHIIVETSPGRFHLYWLVSDCALEQFKPLQQAIAKQFNGDKSCVDICRVLRVPGFYHLKNQPVMTKLLEVREFPRYTTEQVIDGLGLVLRQSKESTSKAPRKQKVATQDVSTSNNYEYTDPNSGEIIDLTTWSAKNPQVDIVSAVNPEFTIGEPAEGKQHIKCPFEHEHSETSPDLATFISNARPPRHKAFDIHCMHNHCAGRDRLDFFEAMLEQGWLSADLLNAPGSLPLKQPSKIFFAVTEVRSDIEWSTLIDDEYRIALHLTVLAYSSVDGTLPDDNWKLARLLGISEDQWLAYRVTLARTGWLIAIDGRLTNRIVKREYDNAQKALMKAITNGKRGGKTTQNKIKDRLSNP